MQCTDTVSRGKPVSYSTPPPGAPSRDCFIRRHCTDNITIPLPSVALLACTQQSNCWGGRLTAASCRLEKKTPKSRATSFRHPRRRLGPYLYRPAPAFLPAFSSGLSPLNLNSKPPTPCVRIPRFSDSIVRNTDSALTAEDLLIPLFPLAVKAGKLGICKARPWSCLPYNILR